MYILGFFIFENQNELIHYQPYQTRDKAKAEITKYIELFYNQCRIQKDLKFKILNQMAEEFYKLVV